MRRRRRCACMLGLLSLFAAGVFPAAADDFQRIVLSTQTPEAFAVAAADFDNDGDFDIAVSGSYAGYIWWLENAWPQINTHTILTIGSGLPRGIAAGDFDGDGDADLIFAAQNDDRFILLENTGSGTVDRFVMHTLYDSADGAWSVDQGDVDGDGDLDLVLAENRGSIVTILARSDTVWTVLAAMAGGYNLNAVFDDFDSDGDLDVVGSANYSSMYWIEQINPQTWTMHTLGFGTYATGIALADLDDDGDRDIAAALLSEGVVAWWSRAQADYVRSNIPWSASQPRDVVAADFDLDGRIDLAACSQTGAIAWFRQTSEGFYVRPIPTGISFRDMTVVDFDRDGDPDILTADCYGAEVALYLNTAVAHAYVEGIVTAARNGSPVSGVEVTIVETGLTVQTAADGSYRLFAAPGIRTLNVKHPCWNEAHIAGVEMVSGDTVTRNASLTQPQLGLRLTSINVTVNNHIPYEVAIPLSNLGDGALHVAAAARGDTDNDPWLSVSPASLDIPAGGIGLLTVRIAADTLDTGIWDYFGEITLRTNACPDSIRRVAVVAYVLDAPEQPQTFPLRTEFFPLYPNPFNGTTRARFALAVDGEAEVRIVDVLGREAMRVFRGRLNAGEHNLVVNANGLASGVYLLMLRAGSETYTQKMLLVR